MDGARLRVGEGAIRAGTARGAGESVVEIHGNPMEAVGFDFSNHGFIVAHRKISVHQKETALGRLRGDLREGRDCLVGRSRKTWEWIGNSSRRSAGRIRDHVLYMARVI